jgi:hypothetical protein
VLVVYTALANHKLILCAAQAFAQLLQAPREEADTIIKERFPVPRLVVCDQYGSQVLSFFTNLFVLSSQRLKKNTNIKLKGTDGLSLY